MSIISVKCTKIQYLQSCVCAENLSYSYEHPQNCCHQNCCFWPIYAPNRLTAWVSPHTPLGSLQGSPRPSSWFRGWALRRRGRREGRRKGRERERKRGEGRWGDERVSWTPQMYMKIINDVDLVQLQCALNSLAEWARQWQLTQLAISIDKCCILNIRKHVSSPHLSLYIVHCLLCRRQKI